MVPNVFDRSEALPHKILLVFRVLCSIMFYYDISDKIPLRKRGNSSPQRAQRTQRNKENKEFFIFFYAGYRVAWIIPLPRGEFLPYHPGSFGLGISSVTE